MKVTKAIIPLGGLSTRFLPASKAVPKCMFPVVDKPILQYLVEELSECGVTDILLLVGRNNEVVLNHFDKTPELDSALINEGKTALFEKSSKPCKLANITYKRMFEPRGVADVIMQAQSFVNNEPFIVLFGDEMFYNKNNSAIKQMLDVYYKTNKSVIGCYNVDRKDVCKYGIMKIMQQNGVSLVAQIVEKPKPENAPSTLSSVGKYILTNDIFNIINEVSKSFNKETNYTEALNTLAQNRNLVACELVGERFDTGNKLGYLIANVFYALNDKEISDEFKQQLVQLLNKNSL